MKFKALSLPDLEQVRLWRNEFLPGLRTPFLLMEEMQEQYYKNVICNRQSSSRCWGIWIEENPNPEIKVNNNTTIQKVCPEHFIGMAGLESIQHENRAAEISLLLNPKHQAKLYEALRLLLREGFLNLNLRNIYTEIYGCNPNIDNWLYAYMQFKRYKHEIPVLPNRKYWNGQYYDSIFLNFTKEDYLEHENIVSQPTQILN